ncbi:50S ribosomal protein L32 [Candidatus Uhrbacteria bacterium]|nr:50S ribosomal protein L32 [Candidatus Uhrbacteria bacterium]
MGLPGHRRTSSHKRRRAAHFALKHMNLGACGKCGREVLPHHACGFCGYYAGRQVSIVKTALDTKASKSVDAKTSK